MRAINENILQAAPMVAVKTMDLGYYLLNKFCASLIALHQLLHERPSFMKPVDHLGAIMLFVYFINRLYTKGERGDTPRNLLAQLTARGYVFPLLFENGTQPRLPSLKDMERLVRRGFRQGGDFFLQDYDVLGRVHLKMFMSELKASRYTSSTKTIVFVLLILWHLYEDIRNRKKGQSLVEGGWPEGVANFQKEPLEALFAQYNAPMDDGHGGQGARRFTFSNKPECPAGTGNDSPNSSAMLAISFSTSSSTKASLNSL